MNPDSQLNLQSILQRYSLRNILLGVGIFVLIMIWLIISLGGGGSKSKLASSTGQNGTIVVNTNNAQNVITVTTTKATQDSETIKSGVPTQIAAGSYTITVKGPNGTQSAAAVITVGKTSTYTINPSTSATAELEPVADVNAISFGVSAGSLYYVDQDQLGDTLDQIDGHNNPSPLTTANITFARWASDGTFGVAQDDSGNLYTVTNGAVAGLQTPGSTAGGQLVYTVASNHNIYLAIGPKIWMYSGGGWHLFATASCAPNSITTSSQGTVALLCGASDGPGGNGAQGSVALLTANGGRVTKNIDSSSAAWAPDGNHLAIFSSTTSAIYDTNLNSVATIPNNFGEYPVTPVWSNNSTVLFNLNDGLWEYSLTASSNQDQLLTTTAGGLAITNLVMAPSGAYVYLTRQADQGSTNDLQIWRFALAGQPFNTDMRVLGNTFPILQGRCLLYLVNFIGTPAIQSFGGHPEDNCQDVASAEVSSININPASLQYQLSNLPPDESPTN